MSDLTFADAERSAIRRRAQEEGADFSDRAAIKAVSRELGYVRNHPIRTEDLGPTDPHPADGDDSEFHVIHMWGCDDEAAIVIGRLRSRGWIVRKKKGR